MFVKGAKFPKWGPNFLGNLAWGGANFRGGQISCDTGPIMINNANSVPNPSIQRRANLLHTIIFKTIETHSPEAYNLGEIESPAPPFQCCATIFMLFQAPTVSAYNTTTLIGEGKNVTTKLH